MSSTPRRSRLHLKILPAWTSSPIPWIQIWPVDRVTFFSTFIMTAKVEKCVHLATVSDTSVLSTLHPSLAHMLRTKKKRMKENGWIGTVMLILNLEIIQNFEKFTFHPNSHKLDQNGPCPPERKKKCHSLTWKQWSYTIRQRDGILSSLPLFFWFPALSLVSGSQQFRPCRHTIFLLQYFSQCHHLTSDMLFLRKRRASNLVLIRIYICYSLHEGVSEWSLLGWSVVLSVGVLCLNQEIPLLASCCWFASWELSYESRACHQQRIARTCLNLECGFIGKRTTRDISRLLYHHRTRWCKKTKRTCYMYFLQATW